MSTVMIRDVDSAAIAKIDELWKKKGFRSREAYLRKYINNLAVLDELKDIENKYQSILNLCIRVIENNTETLERVSISLDSATNSTMH